MRQPRYPVLYQLNVRVTLDRQSGQLGRPATLDDLPDAQFDRLAELGFDWVWLLGVWRTGAAGRQVSRNHPQWQEEFRDTLPDLRESDICGSCFAVTGYTVGAGLGGDAALERLRSRLRRRGLRLMLDFVPNHTALDHPWCRDHPEFYVQGTERDLAREPHNYTRVASAEGPIVLAYGRDPYFAGWPDTLQLNYTNPDLQTAMQQELSQVAARCDGVRCDMAMLIEPEVFERTWGARPEPFWPRAIARVRERVPGFTFLAEVYWDMEWALQQRGFDYTYDKRLYDRLRDRHARPVREHLSAGLEFQDKLVRFLENHDEPRAATTFPPEVHRAAALVTFFTPGLRFFHQGQLDGWRKRIAPHLCRAPAEPGDETLRRFYSRLLEWLAHPAFRDGDWRLLECGPAAEDDGSWDGFIAGAWQGRDGTRLLVAVNFAPTPARGSLRLPFEDLREGHCRFTDWVSGAEHERSGEALMASGLDLELAPWGYANLKAKTQGEETP